MTLSTVRSRTAVRVGLVGVLAGGVAALGPSGPVSAAPAPAAVQLDAIGSSVTADEVGALATTKYSFLQRNRNKTPVRWDPCSVVHYKINRNGHVPKSETVHLKRAFARLTKATGIKFRLDGATKIVPDKMNIPNKSKTDVIIAFANRGKGKRKSSLLQPGTAGMGGFVARSGNGLTVMRSYEGAAVFDATSVKRLNRNLRTSLYLHELAHVVGLGHSSLQSQVMYPQLHVKSPTVYKTYDRIGLKKLGRSQGCVRPPGKPKAPSVRNNGDGTITVSVPRVKFYGKKARYVLQGSRTSGQFTKTSTSPRFKLSYNRNGYWLRVVAKDSLGMTYGPDRLWTP